MIWYLEHLLRLAIWFLLTADLSPVNVTIGVAVSLLMPSAASGPKAVVRDWLRAGWQSVIAIPQAYIEAIEIMLCPHSVEYKTCDRVPPRRTPGLVFLDIFIITFTPKTIVTKYHERGWYEVHRIGRPGANHQGKGS